MIESPPGLSRGALKRLKGHVAGQHPGVAKRGRARRRRLCAGKTLTESDVSKALGAPRLQASVEVETAAVPRLNLRQREILALIAQGGKRGGNGDRQADGGGGLGARTRRPLSANRAERLEETVGSGLSDLGYLIWVIYRGTSNGSRVSTPSPRRAATP